MKRYWKCRGLQLPPPLKSLLLVFFACFADGTLRRPVPVDSCGFLHAGSWQGPVIFGLDPLLVPPWRAAMRACCSGVRTAGGLLQA